MQSRLITCNSIDAPRSNRKLTTKIILKSSTNSLKANIKKYIIRRRPNWAIGIYAGDSPCNLVPDPNINNPVLTAKDVTDVRADFVADPFMVQDGDLWYMFFEVLNIDTNRGEIAFATSNDTKQWNYQQVVIAEPFHLSYPYVFKWNDEYYLIPESCEANSIRLYKATSFPDRWTFVKTLLDGSDFIDASILHYNRMWWLFTTSIANDNLRLYYAEDLMGDWIEHPQSPVVKNNRQISRPGGKITSFDGKIIRYTQDCEIVYGYQVRAFAITDLTTTSYAEIEVKETPIITASGAGWNKKGMHHVDPHQIDGETWIACVDGYCDGLVIGGMAISY